jgi:hypothetical protein
MKSDQQLNSQVEVSIDYMNDRIVHLISNDQTEDARAILMEWEELLTYECGDDSIMLDWMNNYISK